VIALVVPDFWAGVAVTLLAELVLALVFVVYAVRGSNSEDE
jgi:hypothetical protein